MTRPDFSLEISADTFDPNEAPSAVRAMPHEEPVAVATSSLEQAVASQTPLRLPDGAIWSIGLVPAALGVAARVAWPRSRLSRLGLGASLVWTGSVALFRWQMQRLFTEQPTYTVEKRARGLEVRRYPAMITAETTVFGAPWEDSIRDAFARLARYIGGENLDSEKLAMTVPVAVQEHVHEKLPMTAPVTARRDADNAVTLAFVMPLGRRASSLPRPIDHRVTLVSHAERRIAVMKFHGFFEGKKAREAARELADRTRAAGLIPRGNAVLAAYDPPSTLPPLRREEVWIDLA